MTQILACDLHDYVEIVCMRQSRVRLILKDGSDVLGKAIKIELIDKQEWLRVDDAVSHQPQLVNLMNIKTLIAEGNSMASHNFDINF